jgi:hypothetical protein
MFNEGDHQTNEYTVYLNSKRKTVLLHSQVWKDHFALCKYVTVYYDLRTMEIAIQPITDGSSEYHIERYRGRTASINISRTMKIFKLEHINWPRGRYSATWDDSKNWLVIKHMNYLGGDKGNEGACL